MIHAKTLTPSDCVISTRSLGSVKNFEELEARTRALCERGPVSLEGCAWQNVEIFHNQRRTFKWMELELHCYSLVLFHFFLSICAYEYFIFNIFTRTSSLGFDTGVTSTFMPWNNSKRRERHREQQILAGSIWHWEGSVGILWYEFGR